MAYAAKALGRRGQMGFEDFIHAITGEIAVPDDARHDGRTVGVGFGVEEEFGDIDITLEDSGVERCGAARAGEKVAEVVHMCKIPLPYGRTAGVHFERQQPADHRLILKESGGKEWTGGRGGGIGISDSVLKEILRMQGLE